jgi:hypothetical protein
MTAITTVTFHSLLMHQVAGVGSLAAGWPVHACGLQPCGLRGLTTFVLKPCMRAASGLFALLLLCSCLSQGVHVCTCAWLCRYLEPVTGYYRCYLLHKCCGVVIYLFLLFNTAVVGAVQRACTWHPFSPEGSAYMYIGDAALWQRLSS